MFVGTREYNLFLLDKNMVKDSQKIHVSNKVFLQKALNTITCIENFSLFN